MAAIEREEFRDFVRRFEEVTRQTASDFKDVRADMAELSGDVRVLMDARNSVASEMPEHGNFKITKLHVVIVLGTGAVVIAALKLLKVIP